jgi:hypothetical protein
LPNQKELRYTGIQGNSGLEEGAEEGRCCSAIPVGHKIATTIIERVEVVRGYVQGMGFSTSDISAREHVHIPNLHAGAITRAYEFVPWYIDAMR